jgi:hypothetical protein
VKLSSCPDCSELDLEYGFTLKQAHSYNHLFRFASYRAILYPFGLTGKKRIRKQLIRKGRKP